MATIVNPEIGDTYEWDTFNFGIPLLPTLETDTVTVLSIEEVSDQKNDHLVYTLGSSPSISGYYDSVFDQTEVQSYRQESEFTNVYTNVQSLDDIPENDIHVIKFKVDPRRTYDSYFKVTVLELPSNTQSEIQVYIKVFNNFDRSKMIFLNKLAEVESRG